MAGILGSKTLLFAFFFTLIDTTKTSFSALEKLSGLSVRGGPSLSAKVFFGKMISYKGGRGGEGGATFSGKNPPSSF